MHRKLLDFSAVLGLELSEESAHILTAYAELVWEKKDMLNLTSVAGKEEIITRHICDGLAATALFYREGNGKIGFSCADFGSGAGYIGLTIAASLPYARVTLADSLERRCAFLNWTVLKLGLKNVTVECGRLGENKIGPFDFITERAMGPLNKVLPIAASALTPGGLFAAYQSRIGEADSALVARLGLAEKKPVVYILPGEHKERYLTVFEK